MKKTIIRLICVLLLVALFACTLISCKEGEKEAEGTKEPGTTAAEEVTTKKSIRPTVTSAEPETTVEPETKEVDTSLISVGETDPEEQYSGAIDMH